MCQQLPEYGVLFHRVMREKKPLEGEIILGVCAKGVIVYEIKGGCRTTSQNFYWRETATISSNVSEVFLFYQNKNVLSCCITYFSVCNKRFLQSPCRGENL